MYIANPIYDTVFKHLMQNNRVARFFIETIIEMPVESIVVAPHEYTWFMPLSEFESESVSNAFKAYELLSILRYDFVATVHTSEGPKKVLIEIQKAKNDTDLMRFRNYLAEQYKRKDKLAVDGKEVEEPLPIITIYLLGYKLPETDAIVIHVSRTYKDVIAQRELHVKSEFIECLTHDSYVVQIPRIEGKTRTRLEKMLSVFEQTDFYDDKGIIKRFQHDTDDENIRLMLEILYHVGADPEKREEMEIEWRSYEVWLHEIVSRNLIISEQKKNLEKFDKTLKEIDKIIEENKITLEEKNKTLEEKNKIIEENKITLEEINKIIEENKITLEEINKTIEENKITLEEKNKTIEENKITLEEKNKTLEEKNKTIEELQQKLKQAGLL